METTAWADLGDEALLDKKISQLGLTLAGTPLQPLVQQLYDELTAKGLVFNQPEVAPFREKLRSAGFYSEWKGKYGEQAWELLEKSVGKLS